ncbi:hypothetical protein H310_10564 [Aphanomyces invadans]|uniref:Transmembrane protein n=1 Tax=Aphanomyces invadans TaxID=157072 RepID=A0A024TQZ2_9STRA|nr:hypothetical protein H310_10564 [Aphanomyces invadans]ETV96418.1 hypothetical protein H310_10564 [Aphanomyces invadans]|eukprot:XP_008875210.1 hypothetical protein H310_10564 [Aphanomyces invadans]
MPRVQPLANASNFFFAPVATFARPSPQSRNDRTHRFSDARIFCGFAYLAITLALSARFVVTLGEYTTNDFYWANFNTTGMQSFLADLCNAKLPLVYVPTLIDFNRSMAIPKDYSGANTRVVVSPARARSFLLQSIPLDQIIPALQATPFAINLLYPVPHCWVDFNRSFEMAHTAKRQRRCELNDRDNAAVYLESILRNAKFTDVVQSATFLDLNFTVFDALYKTDAGHTWMKYLTTHQVASVATEAATWTSAGLTRWVTQMSNAFQQGLVETITVVNALGIASTITIGNVPYRARGGAYWTTLKASFGIWNDLSICNMFIGCSLVRGASNHFEALGIDWDNDIVIGGMTSPVIELTRRYIGPYGSLDLRFVPVPTVLLDQVAEFQRAYYDRLQQNAMAMASYRSFSLAQVDPIPPLWHDMEFYGGNPMCTKVQPEPYVRETFGFYESCDSSATYSVVLGRDSSVFALQAMAFPSNAVRRICATCRTTQVGCGAALDGADTILSNLGGSIGNPDVPSAIDHLTKMNITMIQFASHNQNKVLLTQSMLDGAELWDFFGWVSMYDWVQGTREVYTFEGDEASVTLVSPYSASAEMTANSLEVPKSACKYMWYLAAYVTFVLTSVGALMVLFGTLIRFRTDPHQSFQFNRVVGSVWIGRPLLLLRGMTAATVLSTSTEQLITIQGFSQITYGQRSIWDVLVLANEALWINYVFVDICLPLTQGMPKSYPPLSSMLAWSVIVALECSSPYESRAVLQHNCVMQRAGREIQCQSGTLAIGSLHRVVLICVVSAIAVVVAIVGSKLASSLLGLQRHDDPSNSVHMMVPGASQGHLFTADNNQCLDSVACIMSGMIPLATKLFDVKLWGVMLASVPTPHGFSFPTPTFHRYPPSPHLPPRKKPSRRTALLGLVYLASTVAGSYVYLLLTESTMSNDMWWATFNNTGAQLYLSSWFTSQLATTKALPPIALTLPNYTSTQRYNLTTATTTVPRLYATAIQDEVNTLGNVVRGLRTMNSCDFPWIFVAHCYVDFGRTWELAPTRTRQQRCRAEVGNGAVFLETFLRNGDWRELSRCWGDALNVGVFDELRTSTSGRDWISTALVDRRDGPVADEVKYWQSYGVSYFSTQWQNFKILGVVESFLVRNALGLTNMFTLKQLNATMQVDSETSNKMHWALAHTFNAICTNESSIGWRSLVRSSHNFAFQNQTPEVLLPEFQALYIPLGPALSAVRGMLGPFGSIDMIRVACPTSLRLLYRNLTEEVALFWRSNATALENATVLFKTQNFAPQMKAWSSRQLIGGNIMCEYDPRNLNTGSDVNEFFTILGRCNSNLLGTINPSGTNMVMSAIATGLNSTSNVKAICDCEKRFRDSCKLSLTVLSRFTPPIASIKSLVRAAIEDVRDTLGIALFQFARQMVNPMAVDVAPAMLFDPNEPEFEFFAWLYLFDWVEQVREVVTFVGEHGRLTTMSGMVLPIVETVNGMEIPTSVSFYVRCAIQYVTFVLLLVGCCLMCYFIAVRGYVEGWNMVKVNRVAGLVWVGRPLILLRGVVAVTLLSTPSLVLVQSPSGIVSYFVSPRRYWLTTFMTSGEACWLVYILNDLCSPLTLHYTAYASKSSNMVWFVTFVVSMLWPVQHEVSVERVCSVEAVDFQVVCKAGTVYFGNVSRCLQLVGISSVSCILCYYLERRCSVGRNDLQSPKCISPFLHAVATHSLHFANWQYNGVTYMDKATAAMMGILSIELHRTLYLFDIKSWRLYTIDPCGTRDSSMDPFLLQAVPLME